MEDTDYLKRVFDEAQSKHAEKLNFTPTESDNFKKAFDDPEFRKMFMEYMDEMQNPQNRAENEAYISQLEGEQKVPEGKELIRPKAGFVAKTHKLLDGSGNSSKGDKVFVNIVTSDAIAAPSKVVSKEGEAWSLPYSLGPPHMEHDKNSSNVACFDCCFHPDVLKQVELNHRFQESLVMTAVEGVEEAYRRQKQDTKLSRDYHVLKGVVYKSGQIATMMVDTASKHKQWRDEAGSTAAKTTSSAAASAASAPAAPLKPTSAPAIKKGFLNNAKSTVYPESVTAKNKGAQQRAAGPDILLPGHPGAADPSPLPPAPRAMATTTAPPLVKEVAPGERQQHPQQGKQQAAPPPASAFGGLTERASSKRAPDPAAPAPTAPAPAVPAPAPATPVPTATAPAPAPVASPPLPRTEAVEAGALTGPTRPACSLVERGVVSMGDFEGLKAKVAVSRPAELVCKIEVPLVTKAAEMVLDVSERQLKLSYRDVYDLAVALPYPVFDKKGVAKFDKAAKTLTVTLPVQPPPPQSNLEGAGGASSTGVVAVVTSNDDEEGEDETGPPRTSSGSSAKAATAAAPKHSRWVHGDEAAELEEARRRSEELAREVRDSADKAKAAAIAAAAAAPAAPVAPAAPARVAAAAAPATAPAVLGDAFMPCAAFSGRRAGYVFRIGPQGLGYYVDVEPGSKSKPSAAAAAATAAATVQVAKMDMTPTGESKEGHPALPLPMEYRQTAATIAVLLQVPGIVADSIRVVFRAAAAEVRFDAATAGAESAVYAAKVAVRGGFLEVPQCRFDVTEKNMVLVLVKREEGLWADMLEQPLVAVEPLPAAAMSPKGHEAATTAKATLIPPTPPATAADPQSLVDQLKRMQLSCAPAVFDLD